MAHLVEFRREVVSSASVHAEGCGSRGFCCRFLFFDATERHGFLRGRLRNDTALLTFALDLAVNVRLQPAMVREGLLLHWGCEMLRHSTCASFHDGLSLADVSRTSLRCPLLQAIVGEHLVVGTLLDRFSLGAELLLAGDDTEALRAVEGRVGDLGLEGETVEFVQVNVFHLG